MLTASSNMRSRVKMVLALAVLCCSSCQRNKDAPSDSEAPASASKLADQRIREMVASEELVLQLTPKLRLIATWLMSGSRDALPSEMMSQVSLPPSWDGLDHEMSWESGSFGVLSAKLGEASLVMKTKFEGAQRGHSGKIVGVRAKQKMTWKLSEPGGWQLEKWEPLSFESETSPKALFQEVLEKALPNSYAVGVARRSYQEELTEVAFAKRRLMISKLEYANVPDIESTSQYPVVSVVDYDGDGFDDLFISARIRPPQLFRNLGDGTFEDVTDRAGLNSENYVNCAIFADFDNDGDQDALLGRSIEPTQYYRNDDGHFHEVTKELSDLGDQYFVTGASVADVNRDGLLDVYLCTYSPGKDVPEAWEKRYLSAEESRKLAVISKGSHPYFNDRGVANVLLMNRGGGRLERAGGESVELWRKSYQPCWFDADGDGDDDLYVCNDFSPDSFLRNDTPRGAEQPVFVDAFAEVFPDGEMAFGMGASAGDYDNDGDLDLFVSNMYSKAGNRIADAVGEIDPRIRVSARGNFLYRNDGGVFSQVAAADAPETRVGWAFGGQFADFNNDGLLDLYVPSGLYTAPKSIATERDL